jgi:hypothetical protein
MQDMDKLLECPVSNLTVSGLRALGYECLAAAKSQIDLTLRARLLERGLELAQRAEALENEIPRQSEPYKTGGTPGPENPEA